MPTKLHQAALDLAAKGVPVFPCRPGTKVPAFKRAFYASSTDPAQIDAWWAQADYNIGISPELAGWCVIDVDTKDPKANGEATLAQLEKDNAKLPDTLTITFYARAGGNPFEALAAWVKFLGIGEYGEQPQGNQVNRIASGEYKGLKIELRATVFATAPTVVRAVTA